MKQRVNWKLSRVDCYSCNIGLYLLANLLSFVYVESLLIRTEWHHFYVLYSVTRHAQIQCTITGQELYFIIIGFCRKTKKVVNTH